MPQDHEQQPLFTYPGVLQWESLDWTDVAGFAPSQALVQMYPQPKPPKLEGDLIITQGGVTVTAKSMRLVDVVYEPGSGGQLATIKLLDERWRWREGYVISGIYNSRLPDGTVDPLREKTPLELLELIFEAMDVTNFDAELFKTDADIAGDRPQVNWDVSIPAVEGQKLVDLYGCRLVPKRSTGKFVVCKTGQGAKLPENYPYQDPSQGIDPVEFPDAVKVFGAPIRYQCRLELEAVGKDIVDPANQPSPIPEDPLAPRPTDNADGSIKPIDQMTYAPNLGTAENKIPSWENESDECENVSAERILQADGSYQVAQELAQQHIRKTYRVKEDDFGYLAIPGYVDPSASSNGLDSGNLVTRRQLILLDHLAEKFTNPDGSTSHKPAYCDFIGTHPLRVGEGNCLGGTRLDTQEKDVNIVDQSTIVSMSIDPAQWLVTFSVPLRRYPDGEDGDAKYPAKVWLNCCVNIRHPVTWQPIRYERVKATPGGDAESKFVLPLQKDDIQNDIVASYVIDEDTGEGTVVTIGDNAIRTCQKQADYYIDAMIKSFDTVESLTLTYLQIVPIDLDGAITQVSYTISKSGGDTKVSRGTEHDTSVPSYKQSRERLLRGELATAQDDAERRELRSQLKRLGQQ